MISKARYQIKRLANRAQRVTLRFKRNQDGVVAVEFAFIGLPFLLLTFAIIEIAFVFMADINITHATSDSARKVRTGQAGISTVSEFINDVCSQVVFLPNCTAKMKADVRVYNSFDAINNDSALDEDGDLRDDFVFNKGGPGSVITVRTFYEWDLFASVPDLGLGNMPNGNRLVEGFAAFRNE